MSLRTTRTRLGAAAVAALAVGALAVGASPASASASSGYVNGAGTYTDDFGDEGTLSSSSYSSSNATCLWQQILWAEGATESNGSAYDFSDVDGHFGPNTTHATRNLQARWGLSADGLVGPQTFGRADSKLRYVSGSTASGEYLRVRYDGAQHDIDLLRATNGRYIIYSTGDRDTGSAVYAAYGYNSCD
ncbi:peptidoglycan-binding protein [Streptomyces sp. TRM70350]|uniref:peptidoglycan-binding domain-containing protein n=1 Tax=Streptomyces sp. TRM70350 TaxID=2856165 RepID=UPI001C44594C|nr:peptidoglycan-binding protein [Streptomyces sp. TRM70350]MBV7699009.1 peptidoglycan-binding protein [Streptomyces sp. TRM70350]